MATRTVNVSGSEKATSSVPRYPFLDLQAQFASIRSEVFAAINRVMECQHFILGPEVEAFEARMAATCGCAHAIGCASGSDALLLALMAIGVEPDDEVITTPFTFGATAGAIARLKARPIFVDIDPETYNIDPRHIDAVVTSRTKAILPVHLFGLMADMAPLLELAQCHGLAVIEDSAQSILATYKGRPSGSMGLCGCFSFFPSKNLGGAGDGGMVTTQDASIADTLKILRAHGCRRKYEYQALGINSRLDALQAAILNVKLRHLRHWTRARQQNASRYRLLFTERNLQGWVTLPMERADRVHVYNQFVIRVADRERLQKYLRRHGIPTEVYYPSPLHVQPAFSHLGYKQGDFPHAERASRELLALPIYPELDLDRQIAVVDAIATFYAQARERG